MIFEQLTKSFAKKQLLSRASEHSDLVIKSVYSGFDPTAKSLHIGNLLPIFGLIQCGRLGVQPYALIGSATALVGDPTGRKTAKDTLNFDEISRNAASIQEQISTVYDRILSSERDCDKTFKKIQFVDNINWFGGMKFLDFLTKIGRSVKVSTMLSKNCVQSRLNCEDGLNYCELSYQLMQGYDFYTMNQQYGVNVQIGGSDQWGNMISGIDIINKCSKETAGCMTLPLLTTSSGQKMGKSSGNGIWLDSEMFSVYDFYQYFASMSDSDALHIFPLLNFSDKHTIESISAEHSKDPSKHLLQQHLAKYMTEIIHGKVLASQVESFSNALFGKSKSDAVQLGGFDIETLLDSSRLKTIKKSSFEGRTWTILELLSTVFPELIKSSLRNMIKLGGIQFNHQKISDSNQIFRVDEWKSPVLVNLGKTSFYFIKIE